MSCTILRSNVQLGSELKSLELWAVHSCGPTKLYVLLRAPKTLRTPASAKDNLGQLPQKWQHDDEGDENGDGDGGGDGDGDAVVVTVPVPVTRWWW